VTQDQLVRGFERLVGEAEVAYGPLSVALVLWDPAAFPKNRNYAFCSSPEHGGSFGGWPGCCSICVAPKILNAKTTRVLGLLMHELGHAIDFQKTPRHPLHGTERRADRLAEGIWNVRIRYDGDMVQSTCCGVYPRPPELGL
jgi:hypothetical protein